MHKYSQSNGKTICEWFSHCWVHKKRNALHQTNRSMEKDFLVNEVWSVATEDWICHQIYTTVILWFPEAVKQWGGNWTKLYYSCLCLSCKQIVFLSFPGWHMYQQTAIFLLTSHTHFLSLHDILSATFSKCQETARVHVQQSYALIERSVLLLIRILLLCPYAMSSFM